MPFATVTMPPMTKPAPTAIARVEPNGCDMPAWANAEIVFYRKDLFDKPEEQKAFQAKYGYPLAPPQTWQQWRDIAKFFTRDTDGDGKADFWGTDTIGSFSEEWMAHVPVFETHPSYYSYHHREAGSVVIEWDRPEAFLWAYAYDPVTVAEAGMASTRR